MSAPVGPASPSGARRDDGASSSSSPGPGADADAVTLEPPCPHAHELGHVSVAIADSHRSASAVKRKFAAAPSTAPAAIVQLMQQRLSLPLVALFPALESELLKLRLAQEKEERARSPPTPKQLQDSKETRQHNQSVMDRFAETPNGQASAKLMEQQRQLEVEAQLALPHVADKVTDERSQLQSTRLYANVPAMMMGEELQRVGAFSRREQQTVWDHVLAMGLNFQTLFSATTTMYVTILMGYPGGFAVMSVFLSFCTAYTIAYPLLTCSFLIPSTMEARIRVYLYEQMMNHGRVLMLRPPSIVDILRSWYMLFFVFSSCILLYTSNETAAQINLINVILQGVTILLYYRSVYDVPSQLTPLVDVLRQGAHGCLASFASQTVVVREEDVMRDYLGITWMALFANDLIGNGKEAMKWRQLLYRCLGVTVVVSQLGFLGFPDLSDSWTRIEPVVSPADRTALLAKLKALDRLITKVERSNKFEDEQNLILDRAAEAKNAEPSCLPLLMLLPDSCGGHVNEVKLAEEEKREQKLQAKKFTLADRLPVHHEPHPDWAILEGDGPGPAAGSASAAAPAPASAIAVPAELAPTCSLAEWVSNEAPFSDVRMMTPEIAKAAAEVVVAATRAGATVKTTPLSGWAPWNWNNASNAWVRRSFWAFYLSKSLADAEHERTRKIFLHVFLAATFAVMLVEIYGFWKMLHPSDDQCADFKYDSVSDTCLRN